MGLRDFKKQHLLIYGMILSLLLHLLLAMLLWKQQTSLKPYTPKATYETLQFSLQTINADPPKKLSTPSAESQNSPKPVTQSITQPQTEVAKESFTKTLPIKGIPLLPTTKHDTNTTTPIKPKTDQSRDPLANFLRNAKPQKQTETTLTNPTEPMDNYTKSVIHTLYGEGFQTLSRPQQEFIKDRLSEIFRVTQITLTRNGYPTVAIQARQEGRNAVSFYLHPNGDISELKLIQNTGYTTLDKNSVQVIKLAFKDYPRPKQKTKIMLYINYIY
jgi:protein TonB